ncbi:MAG: hypothetical protein WBV53_05230 [Solirubrobacterales bacterium]
MSSERRRGLIRLGILLGSVAALVVVGWGATFGSSSDGTGGRGTTAASAGSSAPVRLKAERSANRLPVALHGETVAATTGGLLVIGGENGGGSSTDTVYRLDPVNGRTAASGSLVQPLHDAAAATVGGQTLVFGGGNTSTLDQVQALTTDGPARPVGRLPAALSDLSAVAVGGAAYVLGGYDGQTTSASVFQTTSGATLTRVADLPTPVRYAAAAVLGDKVYAFGGELADGSDTNRIQEYDIATQRAVVVGHLPDSVSHASAVTLDGAIYLLGGRIRGGASDQILRFDPSRNVALRAGHLPQAVFDGAASTYHGRAYLLGGLGAGETALDTVIALH